MPIKHDEVINVGDRVKFNTPFQAILNGKTGTVVADHGWVFHIKMDDPTISGTGIDGAFTSQRDYLEWEDDGGTINQIYGGGGAGGGAGQHIPGSGGGGCVYGGGGGPARTYHYDPNANSLTENPVQVETKPKGYEPDTLDPDAFREFMKSL